MNNFKGISSRKITVADWDSEIPRYSICLFLKGRLNKAARRYLDSPSETLLVSPIHHTEQESMFHEPLCSHALSLMVSMTDSWALFSAALRSTGLANTSCCNWTELILTKSGWATERHPLSKNGTHSPPRQSCVVSLSGSCTALFCV